MKKLRAPLMALTGLVFSTVACFAQNASLPSVNMGRNVGTPGDNQYVQQPVQGARHGGMNHIPLPGQGPPPQAAPVSAPQCFGWQPTPPPTRPDISLEPIAADEPISQPGYPPLPDRLDLPATANLAALGSGTGSGNGGGYSSSYRGSAPPPDNDPTLVRDPNVHIPKSSNYLPVQHFAPGAFIPKEDQKRHGYYKCTSPEYFSADPNAPRYRGTGEKQLKELGQEPKLNDFNEGQQAPEPPQPTIVSQSVTDDLTLPEDEFSIKPPKKKGPASRAAGRIGQRMGTQMNSMMGRMTGMLHF